MMAIRPEDEDDPPPCGPGTIYGIPRVTNADGVVICEERDPRPGSKAWLHNQQNGYATVEILFGKGEVFEKQPIIPTLRELAQLVAGVVDALESHIQRGNDESPV
jgi:hypothetical protein